MYASEKISCVCFISFIHVICSAMFKYAHMNVYTQGTVISIFFFESNCDKYFQPDDYIFCIIYAALVRDVFPDIG